MAERRRGVEAMQIVLGTLAASGVITIVIAVASIILAE